MINILKDITTKRIVKNWRDTFKWLIRKKTYQPPKLLTGYKVFRIF